MGNNVCVCCKKKELDQKLSKHDEEILKKYNHEETRSKNEFQNWLNAEIKQYMKLVDLSSLDYEKHSGRFGLCTGTLVLYNILLVEKYYPHQKFSFGDYNNIVSVLFLPSYWNTLVPFVEYPLLNIH